MKKEMLLIINKTIKLIKKKPNKKDLFQSLRKHKFDLDNPITASVQTENRVIHIKGYVCKLCGRKMYLEHNQMESLPWEMGHNCPGEWK
jgi:hypothetical protein